MICRSLVKNKTTGKQNIIWFGSQGKNLNYVPMSFDRFDEHGDPIIYDNGNESKWQNRCLDLYIASKGPFRNDSPYWGEYPICPSEDLYPSETLYPNSGVQAHYFRLDETTGTYIPVETMPEDWKERYMDYYIAEFELNSDPDYDPSKTYYAHGNRIPAENYSTRSEGVKASLIQRLSVLKGELWYKSSYGLPLTDKAKNKGIYDSIIINIITTQPDVENLISYDSSFDKSRREYAFEFKALTIYGDELSVSYAI